MIDSVSLTRQVRMHSPREMLSLGFRSACQHPSELCTHRARWKLPGGDKKPHLTWSEAPNGSHWLSLTGSLQKFMFGSNVYPLSSDDEIRACIEGTSQYVQSVAQVSFDSFRAYVTRGGLLPRLAHDQRFSDPVPVGVARNLPSSHA